jgi:methylenetetrahydrofolate reductase (NADPH)
MADRLTLRERLAAGRFVVTAEITPPLSASAADLLARAEPLRGLVDAVNVTDSPAARTAMSSFAASAILAGAGIEPVLQVTCRDRNRIAIAGDLLGAAALGVTNLLVLTGDDPAGGDQPGARPVFDLDSRGVMTLARSMRDDGALPSGRKVATPPDFHIGCADTPVDPPADWRPDGLIAKIEAGAEFAQTQFCFDLGLAERYFARLRDLGLTERLNILAGIGPIVSAASARWMTDNLFGVTVPHAVIERLEAAPDQAAEGRAISLELIDGLARIPGIAGVHVMAPQQPPAAIAEFLRASGVIAGR